MKLMNFSPFHGDKEITKCYKIYDQCCNFSGRDLSYLGRKMNYQKIIV